MAFANQPQSFFSPSTAITLCRMYTCIEQVCCKVADLGFFEYHLIVAAAGNAQGFPIKVLANELMEAPEYITAVANRLEENEYLIWKRNPDDKRALAIACTKKAQRQVRFMDALICSTFFDMWERLSEDLIIRITSLIRSLTPDSGNSVEATADIMLPYSALFLLFRYKRLVNFAATKARLSSLQINILLRLDDSIRKTTATTIARFFRLTDIELAAMLSGLEGRSLLTFEESICLTDLGMERIDLFQNILEQEGECLLAKYDEVQLSVLEEVCEYVRSL